MKLTVIYTYIYIWPQYLLDIFLCPLRNYSPLCNCFGHYSSLLVFDYNIIPFYIIIIKPYYQGYLLLLYSQLILKIVKIILVKIKPNLAEYEIYIGYFFPSDYWQSLLMRHCTIRYTNLQYPEYIPLYRYIQIIYLGYLLIYYYFVLQPLILQ